MHGSIVSHIVVGIDSQSFYMIYPYTKRTPNCPKVVPKTLELGHDWDINGTYLGHNLATLHILGHFWDTTKQHSPMCMRLPWDMLGTAIGQCLPSSQNQTPITPMEQ